MLTIVTALPVGSDILSIVPHGKTRVYMGLDEDFVDSILIGRMYSGPLGFESALK